MREGYILICRGDVGAKGGIWVHASNWAHGVGKQELVEGQVLGEFAPPHKTLRWGQQENLHHKPKYCYWSLK